MINDVVLAAIIASESLEGTGHIGAAVQLTTFQQELKQSWKTLSQRPLLGQDYGTNIQNWTCRCGTQQFQPQHLCKHLVQLVTVNPDFFAQLNRRRTMPIYENMHLEIQLVMPRAQFQLAMIFSGWGDMAIYQMENGN